MPIVLSITTCDETLFLSWTGGTAPFSVDRTAPTAGNVATGVTGSTYDITGLTNGTEYTYTVSDGVETSAAASGTPGEMRPTRGVLSLLGGNASAPTETQAGNASLNILLMGA